MSLAPLRFLLLKGVFPCHCCLCICKEPRDNLIVINKAKLKKKNAQCMLGKHSSWVVHVVHATNACFVFFYRPCEDQIQINLKLFILISHLYDNLLTQATTTEILSCFAMRTISRNKSVFRFALA